jgi:hypothetical protein
MKVRLTGTIRDSDDWGKILPYETIEMEDFPAVIRVPLLSRVTVKNPTAVYRVCYEFAYYEDDNGNRFGKLMEERPDGWECKHD